MVPFFAGQAYRVEFQYKDVMELQTQSYQRTVQDSVSDILLGCINPSRSSSGGLAVPHR